MQTEIELNQRDLEAAFQDLIQRNNIIEDLKNQLTN